MYNKIIKSSAYLSIIVSIFILLLYSGLFEETNYYTWTDKNSVTHITKDIKEIPGSGKTKVKTFNKGSDIQYLYKFKNFANSNQKFLDYLLLGLILLFFILTIIKNIKIYFFEYRKNKKNQKNKNIVKKAGLKDISKTEFETFSVKILKLLGFEIETIDASLRHIIGCKAKKNGKIYAVSVVFTDNPVSRIILNEILREGLRYKCNSCLIISNNYFSEDTQKIAGGNKHILIDRDKVAEYIIKFKLN